MKDHIVHHEILRLLATPEYKFDTKDGAVDFSCGFIRGAKFTEEHYKAEMERKDSLIEEAGNQLYIDRDGIGDLDEARRLIVEALIESAIEIAAERKALKESENE